MMSSCGRPARAGRALPSPRHRRQCLADVGRSEASLRAYLKRLPGKENVRVIVMDLSETYRRIAQQYFPNAMIVADRFHVVRLVNQHFLRLWQQHDPEGPKNRGLLSRHHPGLPH